MGRMRDQTRYEFTCRAGGGVAEPLSSQNVVIVVLILWSGHGVKQRHPHRFLIPGDPALTIGCVKGGEAINVVTSKMPFSRPIGKSDTAEWGGWETSRRGFRTGDGVHDRQPLISDRASPVSGSAE